MAKFCMNCGSPLEEGSKFCMNCGASIGTCSFEVEDGLVVFVTFSENAGGVSVNMSWDQTFDDGREYGYLAGSKN